MYILNMKKMYMKARMYYKYRLIIIKTKSCDNLWYP